MRAEVKRVGKAENLHGSACVSLKTLELAAWVHVPSLLESASRIQSRVRIAQPALNRLRLAVERSRGYAELARWWLGKGIFLVPPRDPVSAGLRSDGSGGRLR
jgi:hypothetical protein